MVLELKEDSIAQARKRENQNQGPLLPAPQPQPPAESAGSVSPSPSASSSSSSVSLIGHASDETHSDKEGFFSAKSKYPASSSPRNNSDDSYPQKESFELFSEDLRKNEIIRAFNEGLEGVDPRGKIGKIPENEIVGALKLDSPLLSREEAESICASLRRTVTKKRIEPPSIPAFGYFSKSTKDPTFTRDW